jgi:hypothetical protein
VLSILVAHSYAMTPDFLFSMGVPHEPWMNVFLGHIWVHYLPGGNASWLVIAIVASGLYCSALASWLRARHIEARTGVLPRTGVGGLAVLSPQTRQR